MRKKLIANLEIWSFAQMTSNSDGKTSSSGTMGVLVCTVGTLAFFLGCVGKIFMNTDSEILSQSIVFVGIGAALLGYRKSKGDIIENTTDVCQCPEGCTCGSCEHCKK